jgi:hypothetical protein
MRLRRILPWITAVMLFAGPAFSQAPEPSDSIRPYVDFLKNGIFLSPRQYILNAFDERDIVVFSERLHAEYTQYEMLAEVLRDPGFTGNVYTETGCYNMGESICNLLRKEGLSDAELDKELISIIRNLDFFSLWPNTNFYFLLKTLYQTNQKRPSAEKIMLYPLDLIFSWDSLKCNEQYKLLMDMQEPADDFPPVINRNMVMAQHFIRAYEKARYKNPLKKKALVIENTYHGYTRIPEYIFHPTEPVVYSTAQYIYKTYPGQVKGIFINGVANGTGKLAADGKWDAAFEVCGNKAVAFDLKGTPFGSTRFDQYNFGGSAYRKVNFDYIFDGFIFYTPIKEFRMVQGFTGIFDDPGFRKEYLRRLAIEENRQLTDVKSSADIEKQMEELNAPVAKPYRDVDKAMQAIRRWFARP